MVRDDFADMGERQDPSKAVLSSEFLGAVSSGLEMKQLNIIPEFQSLL